MRKQFIVEVDVSEHKAVLSDKPPSVEEVAKIIRDHIINGCGYYPTFNYNTVTVTPRK